MLTAPAVRVHRGGEHVRERGERCARAVDPAPDAWVHVAERVGQHVLAKGIVGDLGARAFARCGTPQRRLRFRGQRSPRGTLADARVERDDVVDHAVAERAQRFPVSGVDRVECLLGVHGPRARLRAHAHSALRGSGPA